MGKKLKKFGTTVLLRFKKEKPPQGEFNAGPTVKDLLAKATNLPAGDNHCLENKEGKKDQPSFSEKELIDHMVALPQRNEACG